MTEREKRLTALYERLLRADAEHDTTTLKEVLAPTYRFLVRDTVLTRGDRVANARSRYNSPIGPDPPRLPVPVL